MHPFHCLFCGRGSAKGDLPERAAAFLRSVGGVRDVAPYLIEQPPYYVAHLLRGDVAVEGHIDHADRNLHGVTVIMETPC